MRGLAPAVATPGILSQIQAFLLRGHGSLQTALDDSLAGASGWCVKWPITAVVKSISNRDNRASSFIVR